MLNTRPPADFLRPLVPSARRLVAVPVPDQAASAAPDDICTAARSLGMACEKHAGVGEAVARLTAGTARPGRILVCGSLYLSATYSRPPACRPPRALFPKFA